MAATPSCQIVQARVLAEFPDARFGIYNCRHIGSNPLRSWSQHAGSEPDKRYFGNALDIWHVDHKPPGKPADSSPAHQSWLLEVYGLLDGLKIVDQLLGPGDKAHSNHVHVSTWPKMKSNFWYKPPCKGGDLIVIYEDKSTDNTFGDVPSPPPPPKLEDEEMLPLKYGDGFADGQKLTYPAGHPQAGASFTTDRFYKRSDVRAIQGVLRDAGASVNTDGAYTVKTAQAIMDVTPTTGADSNGFEFHGNDYAPVLKAAYGGSGGGGGDLSRGDVVTLN